MTDKIKTKITYVYTEVDDILHEQLVEEVKDINNDWHVYANDVVSTGLSKDEFIAQIERFISAQTDTLASITAQMEADIAIQAERLKEAKKL